MEKNAIVTLKLKGKSNRWIAKETGIDRKTVARYWNEYEKLLSELISGGDVRAVQEKIVAPPSYDISARRPSKYTSEMDRALDDILDSEATKARELGESNKQKLTNRQILGLLRDDGHDIGLTTVTIKLQGKRRKLAEAFIRQEYGFGDRLEFDFGEVKLVIGGVAGKYYLAVFGSPASKFRWAYLYNNQKKAVFLDSHARFFEMMGGVYREAVYDNMKNAVTSFIGNNEKKLNADLIAMSTYYGFSLNVTNCFSGNEKGFVESSVKTVRKEVFAVRYSFGSILEAEEYLNDELIRMNEDSLVEEEKLNLLPYKAPLELSRMTQQTVDKYSFVRIENNFYSVPEYLVGRKVTVRSYLKEIIIYSGFNEVCRHDKKDGYREMSVNILHYLDTLYKKPGAIPNSKALKSETDLKAVYDDYYTARSREFIDIIRKNQDKPVDGIVAVLKAQSEGNMHPFPDVIGKNVLKHTHNQLLQISDFFMKGRAGHGN
jgi:transposase